MWDEEVDVVCVGGAVGGLASAMIAVDAGAEVFVATAPPPVDDDVVAPPPSYLERGWLTHAPEDDETREYFAELSEDLATLDPVAGDMELPTRVVRAQTRDERDGRWVEPFYGGRLRKWATQCLRSPYGLLHSRVADWQTTTMRTPAGRAIEVKPLGPVGTAGTVLSLADWLGGQAHDRQISIHTGVALQRVVFEDGEVAGVVVDGVDGPHAVRARHGVTIAPADSHAVAIGRRPLQGYEGYQQLCLVSESASRFARLELLNMGSTIPERALSCHSMSRQLHQPPRDGRALRSEAGRGRKLHRYPPAGQ
ncbi:hypothetical protein [Mycolicibacterium arseniciresistens]|uniref:FAD-dependent oxidoreductase 2 FAD binding domain-containing protein n=1 Tax=Mycolicibacterium arseniciresistens TaxID=3062257 RepID=A0ABT8UHK8_9MYCO|nr:hypothetical protein [Mycolicibacterium arseniciresistens]MDO3635669.1 hypothetical protein [Mycolicibacterium arseniciresistens]